MQDKNILFLVHRIYKDDIVKKGGADYIADYLKSQGYSITTIEHPLNGSHNSFIKRTENIQEFQIIGKGPIRWIQEIFFNIKNSPDENYRLILAVDPLNFVSAYLIKFFKKKNIKILFHSIDYSENRFGNIIFDYIYNRLYSFSINNADMVTYVSKIMGEKIKNISKKGLDLKRILYYLPNSPEYEKMPRVDAKKKDKHTLVYSKSFIPNSELKMLQNIIKNLKIKYPKILLNIVGNVEKKEQGVYPSLKTNIKLHGLVTYEKNIEIISKSYIGIGWYENRFSFEKYNDSLKLREYAALGLPSVCNDKTSTAIEMENEGAGIIGNNVAEIANAISALISNNKEYTIMRQNALRWAKKNDKSKLLKNLIEKLKL